MELWGGGAAEQFGAYFIEDVHIGNITLSTITISSPKTAFCVPTSGNGSNSSMRSGLYGQVFFRHVLKNIEKHHNSMRPHQGIGNVIPKGYDYPDAAATFQHREVVCDELLGGLLRHYHLKKAA